MRPKLIGVALAVFLVVFIACGGDASGPSPTPTHPGTTPTAGLRQVGVNVPFVLAPGETVELAGAQTLITFVSVTNDSRCPTDVTCVRAGDATVHLRVQAAGMGPQDLTLVFGDPAKESAQFEGYTVTATDLAPAPVSTRTIAQSEYRVTLVVTAG
jgi:hypothetical protein